MIEIMTDDLHATTDAASNHTPAHAGPPPAQPPAPAAPATGAGARDLNTDIAQILKDIQLPQRRGTPVPARPVDTAQPAHAKLTPLSKDEEALASNAPMTKDSLVRAPESPAEFNIPAVHTFRDDVQHVVRDKKVSIIRAASMEQDRHDREPETKSAGATQRQQRTVGILFASALLVIIGFAAIFGVYIVMFNTAGSAQAPLDSSIVFAEQTATLSTTDTSPSTLKAEIARARENSTGSIGSITHVVPTITTNPVDSKPLIRPVSTAEFFRSLGVHAPDELINALGEQFFFGIHTVDTNAPFFVIPVTSYEHAFAGMLQWELTMDADLAPVFPAVSDTVLDANNIPSRRAFQDSVLRNYDVRILRDDRGVSVLYYSFPNPDLLIIAESPYTFTEILSRLQSAHRI